MPKFLRFIVTVLLKWTLCAQTGTHIISTDICGLEVHFELTLLG